MKTYTEISRLITEIFPGKSNAGLRKEIRHCIRCGTDPRVLARRIALTAQGKSGLQAIYDAAYPE